MSGAQGVFGARGTAVPLAAATRSKVPGWTYYLVAATCLVPLVVPNGPGQIALIDVVNAVALGIFAGWVMMRGVPLTVPFAAPMLMILVGSLIATANAVSVSDALMTMSQDLYLYLWFVMLANLLLHERDYRWIRVTWLWAAVAISIVGIVMLMLKDPGFLTKMTGLKGPRASATFYNPNMFADYLVTSLFIAMSLAGQVRALALWAASGVLLFALVATKSNGGLVTLVAGLAAWAAIRSLTRHRSLFRLLGATLMLLGLAACVAWVAVGWGVGSKSLSAIGQGSFLGRISHSADTRLHIWTKLGEQYLRFPLGIGPGNSKNQLLSIADRERPDSFLSKEAHNDYVGYLTERGPLALLGMLVLVAGALVRVMGLWARADDEDWKSGPGGAMAAALIGALVATTVHSMMIEKLHFRHFWMFLAVLWCFSAVAGRRPAVESAS